MPVEPPPSRWAFSDPSEWYEDDDVVAVGADLSPSTVLAAYRHGVFPMHLSAGPLAWWSPNPRGVLPLDGLRLTRSLVKSCRRFTVTMDEDFEAVMRACSDERPDERWITDEFIATYTNLHELGWTHSFEVRDDEGALVGGLYGIEVGGLFAGESMFHRERDASKVALVALVDALRDAGGDRLLDVQWRTEHLGRLGAVEISRAEYLRRLERALELDPALS